MKRLLVVLAVGLLLLTLTAPALVGWLARRAQTTLIEENLAPGQVFPAPLQQARGWLGSDYLWALPAGVRPQQLSHRMRHGPWLGAQRFGWLAGRIELSADGRESQATEWLDYQLGFGGDLSLSSALASLQFPLGPQGRLQLDQGGLELRHQPGASALDFNAEALDIVAAGASLRLLGVTLGALSQPVETLVDFDLRLGLQQLVAGQGVVELLRAAPAELRAQLRAEEPGLRLDLTVNLDDLHWADLVGAARAGLHLERVDPHAVQRLLAVSQSEDTPPEQRRSRLLAAMLVELPALAQQQPTLELSQWQWDTTLGRARLDARGTLQPAQRMSLGTGWISSMLGAEISLAIDEPLLQHLLNVEASAGSVLATLQRTLQETLRREWLRDENGLWRLRARYSESQWLFGDDAR